MDRSVNIDMKALSLKQPFAELVVSGKKTIELRKWNTKFRGEFLVHASKSVDKTAMARFGFTDLPIGAIVGKAVLLDVKKYTDEFSHLSDKDKHLASFEWGTYGFILENAERMPNISCKGSLGFWDFQANQ
jgi:predicted transcriptional regulator